MSVYIRAIHMSMRRFPIAFLIFIVASTEVASRNLCLICGLLDSHREVSLIHFQGSLSLRHSLITSSVFRFLASVRVLLLSISIAFTLMDFPEDDSVRPQTEAEKELYVRLSELTKKPASALSSRWREPSLTVHSIEISGPRSIYALSLLSFPFSHCGTIDATVIPSTVKAQVSLRIVPDQDLGTILKSLCDHLKMSFAQLQSPNQLKVASRSVCNTLY